MRNNSIREGVAPDAKADIPLQPIEETMVEQGLPCSPWKGCHVRAVGHFLKEAAAHREPMMKQIFSERLQPMAKTHAGAEEEVKRGLAAGQGQPTTPARRKAETFLVYRL